MVLTMWAIRRANERLDINGVYDGHPTLFTIELRHGGRFTKVPIMTYVDGIVSYVDCVDIDEFSVHELDTIMLELGYVVPPVIYYHFQIPNEGLEFGLRALANDDDVRVLYPYVQANKLIHVYTEHGSTNLLTYFMSPTGPRRVIIEELDEQDPVQTQEQPQDLGDDLNLTLARYGTATPELRKSRSWKPSSSDSSVRKKLCLEWVEDHQMDATMNDAREEGVKGSSAEVNNPQTEFQGGLSSGIEEVLGQDFDEFDPFYGIDLEETVPAEKNQDQNLEEDECEGQDTEEENYIADESEESEDSDFMVDEDNIIEDVDVDMQDFHMSIDTDVEYMGGLKKANNSSGVYDLGEELDVIDNDEWDSLSDDSENGRKRRALLKQLNVDEVCSHGEVHRANFKVGQKYKSKKELKDKIDYHAIETKRRIMFNKNDKFRLTTVCEGKVVNTSGVGGPTMCKKVKGKASGLEVLCPWRLHASRATDDDVWLIKTYVPTHTCNTTRKIRSCTSTFISKQILDQVESDLTVKASSLREQLVKKFDVKISADKVFRAKAVATKMVIGDYTKQYALLRDYIMELQATNEDTTVKLEVVPEAIYSSPTRQFQRMYVCLGALKKGFRAGLREFLGLDGAFMKGPYPGQVLTAVAVDCNNGIYPVAYAIVESENTGSWKWFLQCLGDDLDLFSNSNFTFISDRQKGLIPALAQVFPSAEHRFCLRHIYENMRKQWRTREYKEHLWKCASATTIPEFESMMKELKEYDTGAYEWLLKIPPHHWAKSHFSGRAISDMLLNNLCEVFNSKIVDGRDKPIITCLEFIREYLMKRICNVVKAIGKCSGPLTPTGTRILEANVRHASQYTTRWNGDQKYQVQGPWHDQHVVDMGRLTCSCRKWELNGIPCKHAIAAINEMADSGETVGELYTYVHKVYWLDTWKAMYSFKIDPIKGRAMWPKSQCPFVLTHPPHQNMPGRPQKKRRKTQDEKRVSQSQKTGGQSQKGQSQSQGESQKLTRKFVSGKCSKCKQTGHNARTCKAAAGEV